MKLSKEHIEQIISDFHKFLKEDMVYHIKPHNFSNYDELNKAYGRKGNEYLLMLDDIGDPLELSVFFEFDKSKARRLLQQVEL
jgi:hypothetical protein